MFPATNPSTKPFVKVRRDLRTGPQAGYKTIRESLTEAVGAPFRRLSSVVRGQSSAVSNETIWALKDVSFEIKQGDVNSTVACALTPAKRPASGWLRAA